MSRHSEKFGNWMASRRIAKKITQAELSALTGIQRPNLSRIERGRHNPSLATMVVIAQALGAKIWVGDDYLDSIV